MWRPPERRLQPHRTLSCLKEAMSPPPRAGPRLARGERTGGPDMSSIHSCPLPVFALCLGLTLVAPSVTTASTSSYDQFQYALIMDGHNTCCSVSDQDSWRAIGKLQDEVERTGNDVFWFAQDDREYVIRDKDLVERVHE